MRTFSVYPLLVKRSTADSSQSTWRDATTGLFSEWLAGPCKTSFPSPILRSCTSVSTTCLILPYTAHRYHHGVLYCRNVQRANGGLPCPNDHKPTAAQQRCVQISSNRTSCTLGDPFTPVTEVWLWLGRSSRNSKSVNKHPWPSPVPNFIQIWHKMYKIRLSLKQALTRSMANTAQTFTELNMSPRF